MFGNYKNEEMKTPPMFSNSSPPISPSEQNQGRTNPQQQQTSFP